MESYLVGVVAGIVGAAGDLRKLFFRQLRELLGKEVFAAATTNYKEEVLFTVN